MFSQSGQSYIITEVVPRCCSWRRAFHYMSLSWHFYPKRLPTSAFNIYEGPFRVQHLAQGHIGMQMGKTGNRKLRHVGKQSWLLSVIIFIPESIFRGQGNPFVYNKTVQEIIKKELNSQMIYRSYDYEQLESGSSLEIMLQITLLRWLKS